MQWSQLPKDQYPEQTQSFYKYTKKTIQQGKNSKTYEQTIPRKKIQMGKSCMTFVILDFIINREMHIETITCHFTPLRMAEMLTS